MIEVISPETATHETDPTRDRDTEAAFYAACVVFIASLTLASLALPAFMAWLVIGR